MLWCVTRRRPRESLSDRMKGKIMQSGPTLLGLRGWVIINQLDKIAEEKTPR